ncbi:hypothetical protein [Demequina sp.]|uniref:hypothetical protein n=1 Tax=Demequina sp. TaxID=2050685 RepID=UPI003D0F4A85
MTKPRARTALSTFAITAVMLMGLTACGGGDDPTEPAGEGTTADAAGPTSDATEAPETDDGEGDSSFVTVSGTGEYAIGTDIPFGGFQLQGEPASQPDGCTWSIVGDDGEVVAENQGSYAFLTDINEADTFVTTGCPDWEQFE